MSSTTGYAVVTGAAQGIGAAVARKLARTMPVAVFDQNAAGLELLVAELRQQGLKAAAFRVDVRDKDGIEDAIASIESRLGPIQVLANVAGILRMGSVLTQSDEDWLSTFAVNTHGVFHVSRAVAKHMVPRRSGAIVTVGSNAAGVPRMQMAAYAASKAASTMFTKCLGLELAQHGIRCNVVSPGSTDTAMQRGMWTDESGPERVIQGSLDTYRTGIPLRRIATPEDIAEAVVFLASEQARHITMHDLCIDGGATLGV
ncbi:2,3-dihydro-2,3-dihydroxybenzoate dehydrogenase [Corallococcus sp. AB049A]|uniref:2,3-dihydro-2,3-dihydroxybenzoate dehydrogenase n=1 Tax=Corallococcus interemptor TaxID=2316720 RepID=A0A3A8QQT6_9BACT|nr:MULTISPECIES: 2,3-dihydro-2,3-dihydroxybenzoate dehydrogenase [Corallococcus]RKH52882.1 2,3-dihydro-2,3-dihydroxybenzoate dehydrogenase [Corallococcus sp. AB050B]RKH70897.1 2,3-dihydro-2,3-dihydroxybenzoate dehydrogenase [Corallococcus interemptor]RKI51736.1 2,3-dihydro-2,3-dihydroxybenzoate dehydrogenase [Corallococcus sp. AB049A]